MDSRYTYALKVLAALDLPLDISEADEKRAIFDAYPYGMRKYHPYAMWLKAVKRWKADRDKLRTYTGRTPRCTAPPTPLGL